MPVNPQRIRNLKEAPLGAGPVVYWMSRDQRVQNNWALIHAQDLATSRQQPLYVVFCLVPHFLEATLRQYDFLLQGLQEIEGDLKKFDISFFLLCGEPTKQIPKFLSQNKVSILVTDFDPLRIKREWKEKISRNIRIPFYEIDTHNIIPCWIASPKQEYGAYTLRPKIDRLLSGFLDKFPSMKKHPLRLKRKIPPVNWDKVYESLKVNREVISPKSFEPGESAGLKTIKNFIQHKLNSYDEDRNDPSLNGQSDLSPYLHFGQISAQDLAQQVMAARANERSKNAFLEELIVRRELADNYCFYNPHYDSYDSLPAWAQKTLALHANDKRDYLYSLEELENASTHDEYWNAAQSQMVHKGKMHGYLRMYWGKKILEWTKTPEEAFDRAIYLNDKYEIDGRDPNGYAGIAWCFGLHDRPWGERKIFGQVRYMNAEGLKRKFNMEKYLEQNKQSSHKT